MDRAVRKDPAWLEDAADIKRCLRRDFRVSTWRLHGLPAKLGFAAETKFFSNIKEFLARPEGFEPPTL